MAVLEFQYLTTHLRRNSVKLNCSGKHSVSTKLNRNSMAPARLHRALVIRCRVVRRHPHKPIKPDRVLLFRSQKIAGLVRRAETFFDQSNSKAVRFSLRSFEIIESIGVTTGRLA